MKAYKTDKQRLLQRESTCTLRNYEMTIPDEESLVNCLVKHLGRVRVSQNSSFCHWFVFAS
jgi:hypothetical protein